MEDKNLNDSLGNPGLISPDKEDLSRLLVRSASTPFIVFPSLNSPWLVRFVNPLASRPPVWLCVAQTVPFSGRIRGGMRPGKKIIVMGIVDLEPER